MPFVMHASSRVVIFALRVLTENEYKLYCPVRDVKTVSICKVNYCVAVSPPGSQSVSRMVIMPAS